MPTFEIDWEYDRGSASNGWSRYAHYLNDYMDQFQSINRDDFDDNRVPFARQALRVGSGPIMTPGLIRCTGPIAGWDITRSDWNGNLIGEVSLIVPAPHVLIQQRPNAGGDYFREPSYSSWSDRYDEVGEQDIERGPYLISTTRVMWQIHRTVLPATGSIPSDLRQLHELASAHLNVLVDELNRQIDPLVAALKA